MRYLYTLKRSRLFRTGLPVDRDLDFRCDKGILRMTIRKNGDVIVHRGYSWNGISPKLWLGNIYIGPPEGQVNPETGRPVTYEFTCLHDALYQFLDHPDFPWTRRQCDDIGLREIPDWWPLKKVYGLFLRLLGGLYRKL